MTEKLRALALAATRPANSQEWAGMEASTAFLLINRHADGWADIDLMMTEWRLANPPENTALLDEIDRLKAELADHERAYELLFKECGTLKTQWSRVLAAADKAHGPDAIRFKLSLYKNGRAINTFPSWLDGRWVSFVFAEDDAHIGYIAKAIDAAKGESHE
jgi:hypothetical protein